MVRRDRRQLPPITREEARSKEEEYTRSKHHHPVVRPTTKKYTQTKALWKEFYEYIGDDTPCLQKNEQAPSRGRLKHFIEWIFETSFGLLTERMTLKSLKNTWYSFRSMYFRETDVAISEDDGEDVLCFIKTELRSRGLATIRREKALADALDVAWLLTYLWCYDKHEFRHPRKRAQISFALQLIVYTGSRLGAIVESSAYRGSNEAMRYKDFELIGLPIGPENTREFVLKVRFRYEKGNRDQDQNHDSDQRNDGDDRYKWVSFREDRNCRGRCPVTHFLGFACADDVFEDIKDPAQVKYLKYPGQNESIHLKIKKSARNTLVLRHCNVDGTIAPDIAMNYNDFARELAELGIRAGLRDVLRPYNLRRGTANEIEGDSEVSPNQYAQLLGHAVKVMGASYISNLSGIDVQGIINHESIRRNHIQMLRSMRLHLNLDIPSCLPFQECMTLLDDPELVEHDASINLLLEKLGADGDNPELRRQYAQALWTRKRCYNKLHQKARRQFRKDAFDSADSSKVRKMIEDGEKGLPDLTDEVDKKSVQHARLDFVSSLHCSDRHRVATSLWTQAADPKLLPETDLVSSLRNLCMPQAYILYYSGESPIDGCCPLCKLAMSELPLSQRPDHIHKCFKEMNQKTTEAQFLASRPALCKWDKCKNAFIGKQVYLSDDFASDIIDPAERRRARAKESKRLNDMRRRGKVIPSRNQSLQSRKSISTHLKRHVDKQTQCLWDGCGMHCPSEQNLIRHVWKSHGVIVKQASFEPQFCFEHPQHGWFTDEFDWEDHCETHLQAPRWSLNLYRSHHMIVAGMQCPFCWVTQTVFSKRFTQFTNRAIFNRHIDAHEKSYRDCGLVSCPVPSCTEDTFSTFFELRVHLFDIHNLKPTGFTQSRGFRESKYCAMRRIDCLEEQGNCLEQDEVEEEELMLEASDDHGDWNVDDLDWSDTDTDEDDRDHDHDWSNSDEDVSGPEYKKRKTLPDAPLSVARRQKASPEIV